MRWPWIVLVTLTSMLLGVCGENRGWAGDSEPYQSTAAERLKAFSWFGGLGYPDVKDRKLTYEPQDLAAFGESVIKYLHESDKEPADDVERFVRSYGSDRVHIFVLAWACWRQGHDQLSAKLFDQAAVMRSWRGDDPPSQTLQQKVAADMADEEMRRAVGDFRATDVSREQILARYEKIAQNFPESPDLPQVREIITRLRRMVQEDKEHARQRQAGLPFDQLTQQDQIAELIFQLRDQTCDSEAFMGGYDIFSRGFLHERTTDTPAHRLAEMGYDAVPQLIAALGDETYSRGTWWRDRHDFTTHILRVGDCAEQVLERIAGRSFDRPDVPYHEWKEDYGAGVKTEVLTWYAELQKKGEKAVLIEGVAKGDTISAELAARLIEKYSQDAGPALTAGIRQAESSAIRADLIESLAWLPGDGLVPLLLEEANQGPALTSRLAAARVLHYRGRPEAVPAMVAAWQQTLAGQEDARPSGNGSTGSWADDSWAVEELISFLAGCDKVVAMDALADGFAQCSVGVRAEIIDALDPGQRRSIEPRWRDRIPAPGKVELADEPGAVEASKFRLLFAALDDTEPRTGMSGTRGGVEYSDPRICDWAACVLSTIAPAIYPFDLGASRTERDRCRIEMKNVWRAAQGLPPLPLPLSRKVEVLSEQQVLSMLDELLQGDAATRTAAESRLVSLGLGALPVLRRELAKLPADNPRRPDLDRLARRIARIVAQAQIDEKSIQPDPDLGAKLHSLQGNPLDPDAFLTMVDSLTEQVPRDVRGMRYALTRDESGTGIVVVIDLLNEQRADAVGRSAWIAPEPDVAKDRPYMWEYTQHVHVGRKAIHGASGASLASCWSASSDTILLSAIREACAAPVDCPLEIQITLVGRWPE